MLTLFMQPKVMNWSLLPRFYRYCPPFIPSVVFAFNTIYQPTHRSLFTFHFDSRFCVPRISKVEQIDLPNTIS